MPSAPATSMTTCPQVSDLELLEQEEGKLLGGRPWWEGLICLLAALRRVHKVVAQHAQVDLLRDHRGRAHAAHSVQLFANVELAGVTGPVLPTFWRWPGFEPAGSDRVPT